jgi:hypothetical protein
MADILAAALWLAEHGMTVFPVDHPDLPKCVGLTTEDHDPQLCTDRGKHPTVKWSRAATGDPKAITAEFAGATRNVAVACGPSRLVVVDEDQPGEWARFCADRDQAIPDTFTVKTGKGAHYYFRQPADRALGNGEGELAAYGCNVRGDGGYVVGPGSKHATGADYYPVDFDTPIRPCPGWLAAALDGRRPAPTPAGDLFTPPASSPADEAGPIPENKRHQTLMRNARSYRARNLRLPEAEVLIRKVWERCAQPPEATTERTWVHALATLRDVYQRYPAGRSDTGDPTRRLRVTPASQIRPRPTHWLWQDRIPCGELCLTVGRGGVGKSTALAWKAARITRGELDGIGYGKPANVVISAAEDSWDRTIVPRLIAAKADLNRIFRVDVVQDEIEGISLSLPSDCGELAHAIDERAVKLLIIDPLMSVVNAKLDTHKDAEVRRALEPLVRLAWQTGVTILGNAHVRKSSADDVLSMVMGSAAFGNVVRAVIGYAWDTQTGECVLSQVKNNLGRLDLPNLTYEITSVFVDTGDEFGASVGRFGIVGETDRGVADILNGERAGPDSQDDTEAWLRKLLNDGPVLAVAVYGAADSAGLSKDQAKRAKKKIRAVAGKDGMTGPWYWALAEHEGDIEGSAERAKGAKGATSGTLLPSHPSALPSQDQPPDEQATDPGYCRACGMNNPGHTAGCKAAKASAGPADRDVLDTSWAAELYDQ